MELNFKTLMFTAISPIIIVMAIVVVYLFHYCGGNLNKPITDLAWILDQAVQVFF